MSVIEDLLNSVEKDAPIQSVLVGAHWTVVCSWHCGLAAWKLLMLSWMVSIP